MQFCNFYRYFTFPSWYKKDFFKVCVWGEIVNNIVISTISPQTLWVVIFLYQPLPIDNFLNQARFTTFLQKSEEQWDYITTICLFVGETTSIWSWLRIRWTLRTLTIFIGILSMASTTTSKTFAETQEYRNDEVHWVVSRSINLLKHSISSSISTLLFYSRILVRMKFLSFWVGPWRFWKWSRRFVRSCKGHHQDAFSLARQPHQSSTKS